MNNLLNFEFTLTAFESNDTLHTIRIAGLRARNCWQFLLRLSQSFLNSTSAPPAAYNVQGSIYAGSEAFLIMRREYFTDWTCDYDLLFFPFDTQVFPALFQSLNIAISTEDFWCSCLVWFNSKEGWLLSGPHLLCLVSIGLKGQSHQILGYILGFGKLN